MENRGIKTRAKSNDQLTYDEICAYAQRVNQLPEVDQSMEFQVVKQINAALAKMANALSTALANMPLTSEQKQVLERYKQFVNHRVSISVEAQPGIDFKSCDSAGITLEEQIARAEEKCKSLARDDDSY